MSNLDLTYVRRSNLDPVPRLVAYVLADHRNETTGMCCPSVTRIVACTGLCERSVQKTIRLLESKGYVATGPPPRGMLSRRYDLRFERLEVSDYWAHRGDETMPETEGVHVVRGACGAGVQEMRGHVVPLGVHVVPPRGACGAPKPKVTKENQRMPFSENGNDQKKVDSEKPEVECSAANAVTLPLLTPPEIMELWEEWKTYRTERATTGPKSKRIPWSAQAARMTVQSINSSLLDHPPGIVADQIRAAIAGNWNSPNLQHIKPAPRQAYPSAKPKSEIKF